MTDKKVATISLKEKPTGNKFQDLDNKINKAFEKSIKDMEASLSKVMKTINFEGIKKTVGIKSEPKEDGESSKGIISMLSSLTLIAGTIGLIYSAIADFPMVVAIMKMLKLIIMALLMPLIPILKPLLVLLSDMAKFLMKTLQPANKAEATGAKIGAIAGIIAAIVAAIVAGIPILTGLLIVAAGALIGLLIVKLAEWLIKIWPIIVEFFAKVVTMLGKAFGWIYEKIVAFIGLLGKAFGLVYEAVKDIGKWIWEQILRPALMYLKDIGVWIWNLIKSMFKGTINAITQVWAFIKTFFKGTVNAITQVWDFIKGLFKGTISASSVWSFIKGLFKSKENNSSGTSKSVNDAIITPQGTVYTNPNDYIIATKNPGALGGKGGMTVNINIDKPTVSNQQDIKALVKAIEQELYKTQKRYNSYA